ncbi:gliding motility-associated C-terminal domain-containing protein [Chitinophaga costaii]|uniref:Gliding motility-associated C-terminal domain-containing protein n=1 Tax=Chitinophaga costaii TaxID=1335309 RepID=A0A1C3ZF15_9BACT|nr:PKD domain-containing protein [Chitinophaga costaii]PUZ30342.1 PKD domain-containing protein [Chitinophaga costaii]SCB80850.1 gliding motility-associated C-terminal domain-containing protein [Chitinophaga costaii]
MTNRPIRTLLLLLLWLVSLPTLYAKDLKSPLHVVDHRVDDPFTINTTCLGDSVKFTITDTSTITAVEWDFGDPASGALNTSTIKKAFHQYSAIGTYTVTLTATHGATTTVTTQDITIVTPVNTPSLGPQDLTLCEGKPYQLVAPNVPGATYQWQDTVTTTPTYDVVKEGTYRVKINGCLDPDSVNIFFSEIPVNFGIGGDETLCPGQSMYLDATVNNATYEWYKDTPGAPVIATTPSINVNTTGHYYVKATVQGCGDYTADATITIAPGTPVPASSFLGLDTMLCPGETRTFTANLPSASRWRWNTGATTPSITVASRGNYSVFVDIPAPLGGTCSVIDSAKVDYYSFGKLNLGGDTTICKGETLVLSADRGVGNYLWQDGSDQAVYYVTQAGYYFVEAKIARCPPLRDTIQVAFDDTLRVRLPLDTMLCNGETLRLLPIGAGPHYKWQDSSSISTYNVTKAGIYAVVATNTCGKSVDSVTVYYQNCDCQVVLPTAFSPNNDGHNDLFRPVFRCPITDYTLSIYDRWGNRVYFANDPTLSWNGLLNGKVATMGAYAWVMQYRNPQNGQMVMKTGSVTVVY